mmetsp:Transcript_751/g.1573  ORF Transcript_751/g.1573 Transcript_751/m.1573 type:complete len:140 (-) Transcript_751:318-737(-)
MTPSGSPSTRNVSCPLSSLFAPLRVRPRRVTGLSVTFDVINTFLLRKLRPPWSDGGGFRSEMFTSGIVDLAEPGFEEKRNNRFRILSFSFPTMLSSGVRPKASLGLCLQWNEVPRMEQCRHVNSVHEKAQKRLRNLSNY